MNDDKYIKAVEESIEENKRLIEKHCAFSDVLHKVSSTSDYLRGLKDNDQVDIMTYNSLKNRIEQLATIAWRECKCERKKTVI